MGDYVIVHVGFAISKVDREEAERTYQALRVHGPAGRGIAAGNDGGPGEIAVKYIDEYRDERIAHGLAAEIRQIVCSLRII